jgi:hypothetical protein
MSETENVLSRWSRLKRRAAQGEGAASTSGAGEARTPERPVQEKRAQEKRVREKRVQEKRAQEKQAQEKQAQEKQAQEKQAQEKRGQENATMAPAPGVDVGALPPIESIVAGSDIRAFLKEGVPAALTRAALRQAWSSDPAIRDFVELAENQWDFARPETIPGFGPLGATDEVQRLVAQALGEWREDAPSMGQGHARDGEAAPTEVVGSGRAAPHSGDAPERLSDHGKVSASDPEPVRAVQHADSATANSNAPARRRRRHGGALPF